ncbi:hypothetical protein LXA43DRAFT_885283, partial [Ganoderma leucocontextum]
ANRAGHGAQPSHPPAADPRFLLMQKLEVEKRRALGVPTAEKAQLSSSATAGHDAGRVPTVPPADVRREGLTKSAVWPGAEGVAAGRQAPERREAELRSQAQLRVRLAAATRAAAARQVRDVDVGASGRADDGTAGTGTGTGTGPGSPPISIDDGLMSHEIALRGKLKARKA